MEKKITVSGTAENLKAGAAVMTGSGNYFVDGLDYWPDSLRGRRVEVTGIPSERQMMPVAEKDSSGAWSQGTATEQHDKILLEAEFRAVDR